MRIVGGRLKRRPLATPEGLEVRPTSDRARESLFNILAHHPDRPLADARVLDVFAGTGALGLEALSRGAAHCTFIETLPVALAAIRTNIGKLGLAGQTTVLRADALRPGHAPASAMLPAGLVFLDPPYRSGRAVPALEALGAEGWLAEGAMISVEVGATEDLVPPAGFELIDERRYGAAKLLLLRAPGRSGPPPITSMA